MLNKNKIESKLRENKDANLIWIASSEKLKKSLIYRLYSNKSVDGIRGVVLIGSADNRLSIAEQKAQAELIESNVSSEAFDKFCNEELAEDLIGRIFC